MSIKKKIEKLSSLVSHPAYVTIIVRDQEDCVVAFKDSADKGEIMSDYVPLSAQLDEAIEWAQSEFGRESSTKKPKS